MTWIMWWSRTHSIAEERRDWGPSFKSTPLWSTSLHLTSPPSSSNAALGDSFEERVFKEHAGLSYSTCPYEGQKLSVDQNEPGRYLAPPVLLAYSWLCCFTYLEGLTWTHTWKIWISFLRLFRRDVTHHDTSNCACPSSEFWLHDGILICTYFWEGNRQVQG